MINSAWHMRCSRQNNRHQPWMLIGVLSQSMFQAVVGDKYTDKHSKSGSWRMIGMVVLSLWNCQKTTLFFVYFWLHFGNNVCINGGHYTRCFECHQWIIVWDKIGEVLLFWDRMFLQISASKRISVVSTRVDFGFVSTLSAERSIKAYHSLSWVMCLLVIESSQIIFAFAMWN